MNCFTLRLLSAGRSCYDGDCVSAVLPCPDGSIGIMAHHSPMAIALAPGKLRYRTPDGSSHCVTVSQGLAKVENNCLTVLAVSMEPCSDTNQ